MVREFSDDDIRERDGAETGRGLGRPLVDASVASFRNALGYPRR
jgi:hypothetical protein